MSAPSEFDDAAERIERVKAEFMALTGGGNFSARQALQFREYAKSRTDLHSDNLTPEQAAWRAIYEGLEAELSKMERDAGLDAGLIKRIHRIEALEAWKVAAKAKLKACPNDKGFKVPWGFLVVGLLIGWLRSGTLWSVLVTGLLSCMAGLLFSIFALDSADVQSTVAIWLNQLRFRRVAEWLYGRSMTIR